MNLPRDPRAGHGAASTPDSLWGRAVHVHADKLARGTRGEIYAYVLFAIIQQGKGDNGLHIVITFALYLLTY